VQMKITMPARGRTYRVLAIVSLIAVPAMLTACAPYVVQASVGQPSAGESSRARPSSGQAGRVRATPMPPPQAALHGQSVGLGRNGQAWGTTKTDKQVLLRTPHGWQTVTLPVAPAAGDSVAVTGDTVVAVGFQGEDMVVQSSRDLGKTWSTKTVRASQSAAGASITVSSTTGRFLTGAQQISSLGVVAPPGPAFVGDDASSLREVSLPGDAKGAGWAGNALLATGGGVGGAGTRLLRSDDSGESWTDLTAKITGVEPPSQDIPAGQPYFGPVLGLDDGTAVALEETLTGTGISCKVFHFADDGTYAHVASFSFMAEIAGGPVALVSSTYGADAVIVAAPDSATFIVVKMDGEVNSIPAVGLPAGPEAISFQDDANGLARVSTSSCASDKTHCASTSATYATTDGGYSWSAV